jgi:hypothetical protein
MQKKMSNGWIKIHRQILEWEWYDEPNTLRLFLHLLLKANHKTRSYRGVEIKEGQIMTGYDKLAKELNLSTQKIRTSISKLKSTSEITSVSTSQGTIIQIVKYKDYQVVTSKTTDEQQTDNKPITTNKNVKKEKEIREVLSELHSDKVILFKEWKSYRDAINKPIKTIQAFKLIVKKLNDEPLAKVTYVINNSIENGWQGLFWDKYDEVSHKPKKEVVPVIHWNNEPKN